MLGFNLLGVVGNENRKALVDIAGKHSLYFNGTKFTIMKENLVPDDNENHHCHVIHTFESPEPLPRICDAYLFGANYFRKYLKDNYFGGIDWNSTNIFNNRFNDFNACPNLGGMIFGTWFPKGNVDRRFNFLVISRADQLLVSDLNGGIVAGRNISNDTSNIDNLAINGKEIVDHIERAVASGAWNEQELLRRTNHFKKPESQDNTKPY